MVSVGLEVTAEGVIVEEVGGGRGISVFTDGSVT